MNPGLLISIVLLFAGIVLIAFKEWKEALKLGIAVEILRGEEDDEHAPDPAHFGTLIERIRMVLSTTKLLQLLAWLFILPSAALLSGQATDFVSDESGTGAWLPYVIDGVGITILVMLTVALYSYVQSRAIRLASRESFEPNAWLTERELHPPTGYWIGWIIWERVMALFGAIRPQAQLYEQDRRVRLRIISPHGGVDVETPATDVEERTEDQMVRSIQRLDRTLVREIMSPINQVTAIRLRDYSPRRLLELCRRTGYTRIPCYDDQVTNLKGYINVYDLLEEDELPESLESLVTKALLIPEVARVDEVLQQMIRGRQQVAIVFDEFGGTSGWLSREDILEEIVGEVADEYERPYRLISESKGGYLVDPSVDLDDLREEIGLELPKHYADTIAGWVYYRLGRVPKRGETIEEKGWKIRVAAIDNHRIRRLRLIPPASTE